MPSLIKSRSGLVYENHFDNSLESLWSVTPNDNIAQITGGQLRLSTIDNNIPSRVLLDIPDGIFTFYAKYSYTPVNEQYSAGLVFFKGDNDYLELQEYDDSNINPETDYQYLKAENIGNDDYEFYGSIDGLDWQFVGTSKFEKPGKMGFYLRGSGYLDIEYMSICRSDKVYLYAVPQGARVTLYQYDELEDEYNEYYQEVNTDGHNVMEFNLPPDFVGYFALHVWSNWGDLGYRWNGLGSSEVETMNGGDEFVYNLLLDVEMCNGEEFEPIEQDVSVALGEFEEDIIEKRLRITNNDSVTIGTLQVSVIQKGFNRGYRNVDIAQSDGGSVFDEFEDVKFISDIAPGTSIEITMRIQRDGTYLYDRKSEFIIDLKGW
jgi:hypothetical protein